MSAMEMTNVTKQFFKRAFSEDKRYDGRKLLDLNTVEIEYGVSNKAEGSARVKLGKTEVIAGVKLAISEPYPDSQDKQQQRNKLCVRKIRQQRLRCGCRKGSEGA